MRAALLVLLLAGCATAETRWLTQAEDAALKQQCENNKCVIVPTTVWQQIQRILQAMQGQGV